MIIKNLTRKTGGGQLIRYVFRYILKGEKQLFGRKQKVNHRQEKPFIIRHNVRSRDIAGFIKEFRQNELNRIHKRADQVIINHTILSWSKIDTEHINDNMLRDIAKAYINLRGRNNLYVGTKHTDRDHIHLHFAMSGSQLSGLSNRISKGAFAELKVALDAYQKERYPELVSLPRHGRSKELKLTGKGLSIDRHNGRVSKKETLLQSLETAFGKSKSIEKFLSELQEQGYTPYFRGADKRLTGIQLSDGRKHRFSSLGYSDKLAGLNSFQKKADKELQQLQALRRRGQEREIGRSNDFERTLGDEREMR